MELSDLIHVDGIRCGNTTRGRVIGSHQVTLTCIELDLLGTLGFVLLAEAIYKVGKTLDCVIDLPEDFR